MKNFIDDQRINTLLTSGKTASRDDVKAIIEKAKTCVGLSLEEVAVLLQFDDQALLEDLELMVSRGMK